MLFCPKHPETAGGRKCGLKKCRGAKLLGKSRENRDRDNTVVTVMSVGFNYTTYRNNYRNTYRIPSAEIFTRVIHQAMQPLQKPNSDRLSNTFFLYSNFCHAIESSPASKKPTYQEFCFMFWQQLCPHGTFLRWVL